MLRLPTAAPKRSRNFLAVFAVAIHFSPEVKQVDRQYCQFACLSNAATWKVPTECCVNTVVKRKVKPALHIPMTFNPLLVPGIGVKLEDYLKINR